MSRVMSKHQIERRRFLKLIGATALTAPFIRSLPSYAGPGNTSDPVYLVLLFTPNGCVRYRWGAQCPSGPWPTGPGSQVVAGPLQFRQTLSAFTTAGTAKADLTKWVTVLDGLHNEAAGSGSHEAGMATLWTGVSNPNGVTTPGASIDQTIAGLLSTQLNIAKSYPTLSLYAKSNQDYTGRGIDNRMLYDSSGNYVDPIDDPATALSTLFPSSSAMTMTGPKDNTAAIRGLVQNQVNADLTALQGRLCNDDKAQLQSLQDLYNQAITQINNAAAAAASCTVPNLGAPPGTGDPYPYNITAMSTLMAMAMACDLTRVGSLQLSQARSPITLSWLGSAQTTDHHSLSHEGPTSLWSLGTDLYATSSTATMQTFASQYPQALLDIEDWYAAQVASFCYTLSQLTTVTGKNLLDQTVVCWGSELDMGAAHNHDDTPFVLIGGGGGAIKTNQLVRFPLNLLNNAANNPDTNNRFHNDLLITLAQIMGVSLPGGTFGDPVLSTGPITEILA
jgi:hypothetical protein